MYHAANAPRAGIADLIEDALVLFVAGFRRCWPIVLLFAVVVTVATTWSFLRRMDVVASAPDPAAAIRSLRELRTPVQLVVQLAMMAAGILTSLALASILFEVSGGVGRAGLESPLRAAWRLWPAGLLSMVLMAIACGVGFLLLVVPGIYVSVRLMLWTVALVDERSGALTALRTSWRLSGGHWWRTFGVVVLIGLGFGIAMLIVVALVQWLVASRTTDIATRMAVAQVTQGLLQVIGLPLITAALVVVYRDLRLRAAADPGARAAA